MRDEEARLVDLASRVSDGRKIDWEEQTSGDTSAGERELMEELKTLESLAGFHRAAGSEELPGSTSGRETWANLEILEKLGAGSFGDVFRAWDSSLHREVALKLLRSDASSSSRTSSILREGRILARLKHPNVATVHGAAEADSKVGVWMELIRGRTLAELVEDQGPMGAREAAGIGIDLCRAVAAVHREGLVHRDIKAQNVMRERGGRIVLMDFGLGAKLPGGLSAAPATLSGTPLYMAPELLRGAAATVQSDIYAIGVLLFHLVTGTYPIRGEDLEDLSRRHQRGDYQLLRDVRSDLPKAFVLAVERALAAEPNDRYQTVGELEQTLDRTVLTVSGSREMVASEGFQGPTRRWLWPAALALLAVLAAVAAALWINRLAPNWDQGKIPIAVIYFDNFTGDSELDWLRQGIPDQLIYSLSRSDYLQVRSMDRMQEVFTNSASSGVSANSRLRSLGERARVRYVVGGSVFLDEGRLTIISQIHNLASNSVLESQKVAGASPDDLFEMVGTLSREIRRVLEIETEDSPEIKEGVARLKTDSKDAFKAYVQCRQILQGRRYQEALPYCREAVSEDPDFLHAWDLLANLYDNLGEQRLALDALDNAVRLLGRVPRADQLTVLLRQAQIQESWEDYERYLKELQLLQPDDPTWPFRLGWLYATHLRDYDRAIREYRQASGKGAEPRVHGYTCFAFMSAARYPEALQSCRRFVQENPQDASAHDGLGYLLMLRGEYDQARQALQQALALRPNFSHALRNLGELELLLGKVENAQDYFERYLEQASGEKQEKEGRWSLGWFHWDLNQLPLARQAVEAALRQDPMMIKAHWLLGLIQVELGDLAGARSTLEIMDNLYRRSTSLRLAEFGLHLSGRIALARPRPGEAVSAFQKALDLGPSERPLFLVALAEAHLAADDRASAIATYREALAINPRFPAALLGMARLQESLRETDLALESYRAALSVFNGSDADFPARVEAERAIRRLSGAVTR